MYENAIQIAHNVVSHSKKYTRFRSIPRTSSLDTK